MSERRPPTQSARTHDTMMPASMRDRLVELLASAIVKDVRAQLQRDGQPPAPATPTKAR